MKHIRHPLISVSRKVKNSAKKLSTRFTRLKRSGFLWAVELEGTRTSLRSTVREMRPFPRRHFAFAPGERGNQHETLGAQIQKQETHTAYSLKLSEVTTHDLASSNISESAQSGSDALLQFQLLHNLVPTFELQTDALEVSLALCPDIPGLLSTIHAHQNILDPTNPTSSLLESPRSEATDLLQKQGVAQLEVWRTDMQGSERRLQARVLIASLRQHLPGLYAEAPLSKVTRTVRERARELDDDEGGDDRHGKRSRVGAPKPGRSVSRVVCSLLPTSHPDPASRVLSIHGQHPTTARGIVASPAAAGPDSFVAANCERRGRALSTAVQRGPAIALPSLTCTT
ncbi:unnamed protein product [Mycena citricolor]|uniref:Uncharacterized protein n=1 Tax=Mycena citricolor TaxID=2018698 RepID=A0AAD2JY51_9AGAR|nr:unnamed protein product [Mycena citricolor]